MVVSLVVDAASTEELEVVSVAAGITSGVGGAVYVIGR